MINQQLLDEGPGGEKTFKSTNSKLTDEKAVQHSIKFFDCLVCHRTINTS